jgi:hypothetical protein
MSMIPALFVALAILTGLPSQPAKHPPTPAPAASTAAAGKRIGDPYPFATCPISGKKLGDGAVTKLYEGREIRFCCSDCPAQFEKDLKASLAKVDEKIIKDQSPLYPIKTSVVSGKDLPSHPVDFVYGNRLVRLADKEEEKAFLKDPAKHIETLDKAAIKEQAKDYPLTKCVVSDEAFGGDMGEPVDVVLGGRLIRLCCPSCKKELQKDPAKFIAAVDKARKEKAGADGAKPRGG